MFEIPDDLAPETYPMAWLVGRWRGYGVMGYPNIDDASIIVDANIVADNKAYLTVTYSFTIAKEHPNDIDKELPGAPGVAQLSPDRLWTEATGYLRQSTQREGDLEAMVAHPEGRVTLAVGRIDGPRATFASDAIVRSETGADVAGTSLQLGLVEGDMLFALDMAAFGEELQSYAAGRLSRVTQ